MVGILNTILLNVGLTFFILYFNDECDIYIYHKNVYYIAYIYIFNLKISYNNVVLKRIFLKYAL